MTHLDREYQSKRLKLVHCKGARKSFERAVLAINPKKREAFTRGILLQFERLLDGQPMSSENFPSEGKLPDGAKFFAFKRIPIRGYCWRSSINPDIYYVSHYIAKKQQRFVIIGAA
jgi:hypothetical protein